MKDIIVSTFHSFYHVSTLALVVLFVTMVSGCDFSGVRENPNAPTSVKTAYLFTNAVIALTDTYWGGVYGPSFTVVNAQYWSLTQYTGCGRYSGCVGGWGAYYLALIDLQEVIHRNREAPEKTQIHGDPQNQIAASMIMQAWTYQVITDIWGPAPFTAALAGTDNLQPVYTSQEEIYVSLLDSLTKASNMIEPEAPGFGSADLIYNGDMGRWKKFANALKMRIATRMSGRKPERAARAIQEALAAGVFTSNADNALVPFLTEPPYQNPIYEQQIVQGRDDWGVSGTLIKLMKQYDDPRLPAYAREQSSGGFEGFPFGLESSAAISVFAQNSFSRPSQRVYAAEEPAILMLYDEVLFMKAEAAQRGFISGDPAQFYREALRASMHYWGVNDESAIDAYINRVPYDASQWKQVLGEQKWLAMYTQGLQGWSVWRHLDFTGVLHPPLDGTIATFEGSIPVRSTYPNSEKSLNTENVRQAIRKYLGGEDNQGVLLWWDVNRAK